MQIIPGAAPNTPSELPSMLTEMFGADVLDEAYVARGGYVLVSEDMYYRQAATAAVGGEVKSVWLQPIFAFARKASLIDAKRQAEITVKLAWRRHGHLSLDAETLLSVLQEDTSAELVRLPGDERLHWHSQCRSHVASLGFSRVPAAHLAERWRRRVKDYAGNRHSARAADTFSQ